MEAKGCKEACEELVKNSREKNQLFTEVSATTTSMEARSNSRSARKKNVTKKSDLDSEIKGIGS